MSETETVYPNVKYRHQWVIPAVITWIVFYLVPGIIVGRAVYIWPGLLWILGGAVLLARFLWCCHYPVTLFSDRDGFKLIGRKGRGVSLGYEQIHEVMWEERKTLWRRIFGPFVFYEPLWHVQNDGNRQLVIIHGGFPLVLKSDEFARLDDFVDQLKERRVPGLLVAPKKAGPQVFGSA